MSFRCGLLVKALISVIVPLAVMGMGWLTGGGAFSGFCVEYSRLALLFLTAAMFFAIPFALKRVVNFASRNNARNKPQGWMVIGATALSFVLGFVSPMTDAAGVGVLPGGEVVRWAGVLLYAAGGIFMIWGPLHLGRQFSMYVTLQENHELVTSGPFSFLRHPRYAGCLYWGFALPMVFLSGPGMLVAVVYAAFFLWRIHGEERMLEEHFKDRWVAYAARTKRLIPFVY